MTKLAEATVDLKAGVAKFNADIKGAVSRLIYREDAPDAEAIMLGLAPPKRYGAVGIGRHGNVLQWGYAAPPAKMTPAGRNLFVNCIAYIRKFDGKRPESCQAGKINRHIFTCIRFLSRYDSTTSRAFQGLMNRS